MSCGENVVTLTRLVRSGAESDMPPDAAPGYRHRLRASESHLRIALGAIWLLDGALQFQPYMFTRSFVNDVLVASAQGNTGFVSRPTLSIAHFIAPNIVAWNALFATVQVAIGVGILVAVLARRSWLLRLALAGSFIWSALVWWLSEGLGGVLTGASPLSGAPGAVLLYVVAGILLWPGPGGEDDEAPAPLLQSRVATGAWLALWAFSAFLLLQPQNQARGVLSSLISQAATGEPHAVHSLLAGVAGPLRGTGPWVDSILALVMLMIGLGVALRLHPRLFLVASIVIGIGIWVFGEAFGGILTGQGTDPNSGPLWVLLACCMWAGLARTTVSPLGQQRPRPELASSGSPAARLEAVESSAVGAT